MKLILLLAVIISCVACSESYPKKEEIKGAQGQTLSTYTIDESGNKQGLEVCYFDDGVNVKSEIIFLDGKKNGVAKTYFADGKEASVIEYVLDKPIGKSIFYSENGKVRREEDYTEDSELIRSKTFYSTGKLKEFAAYRVADNKMSSWKYFNEFGEVIPSKSNFIQVRKIKGTTFEATIINPDYKEFDSILVFSAEWIKAPDYKDVKTKRKMKFSKSPMVIDLLEEDYFYSHIHYLILAYPKGKNGEAIDYRLFWERTEPIPEDNVRPIF